MKTKIIPLETAAKIFETFKHLKQKIVFTNGCFDILHIGHIDYLTKAKRLGDILIVGLNSDNAIRALKGSTRPYFPEKYRALMLSALSMVDYIILFDDISPLSLIESVKPDVLVKGADWDKDDIIGGDFVKSYGGKIETIDVEYSISTSSIIKDIQDSEYCKFI